MQAQVNAEQVLLIGRNVLSMDDYMLAIQYFNQAIKAKPYLADPYFFRGLAKLNLEDYAGAEADCTLALERNKFKTEAYKVRGFARQQLDKDSLAILDYDRGLAHDPTDKYFLFYKAVAQTSAKRYEGADSTFAYLLRRNPKFDDGYSARARLRLLTTDTVAALEDIEKAISISKAQVNPFLMRADIMAKRGEWKSALADMDEAVRLMPEETDLYINRAFLRYKDNDFFGAMSDYNYAIDLEPQNTQALFNRGLLRFEVRDLTNAAADFSALLRTDPQNFHALYNRGLISLELRQYSKAQKDFQAIATRYPKFYIIYYALAECRKNLGDLRGAFAYMNKADDLVRRYVDNPKKNPLDYPTIDARANETSDSRPAEELSDIEVMERFNRLVTNGDIADTRLSYEDRIKGKVQDRNLQVEPEPMYALSFIHPEKSLQSLSNYFRELDQLNQQHYIPQTLWLLNGTPFPSSETLIKETFDNIDKYSAAIASENPRPVDFMARGVLYTMVKNYPAAIADFTEALKANPEFTVALMGRAYAEYGEATSQTLPAEEDTRLYNIGVQRAMADYNEALRINPRLIYAWHNKGNLYFSLGDFTSALQCFSEAIAINPAFGQAYFNRGLCYLQAGNSRQAFADLSKAGELGILPSYNLLKRMK